jgi:hypothetical protein
MKTPIFIIIPLLTILLVIGMPIFEPDMLDGYLECNGKTSVTIPLTVTTIGGWDDYPVEAFLPCTNLTSINVNKRNPAFSSIDGVLFDKSKQTLLAYPRGKQGAYNIPNGVSTIEAGAFTHCFGLTSVAIPKSVTTINSFSFFGCTGLTSVTIPNSVTSILYAAFLECKNLTSVTVQNPKPPHLEEDVFRRIDYNPCLYVPESSINAYRLADGWKEFNCIKAIASVPE